MVEGPKLAELSTEDRPAAPYQPCPHPAGHALGGEPLADPLQEVDRLLAVGRNAAAEVDVVRARVDGGAHCVDPAVDVHPDRDVERVRVGGQRLVHPAARQVENVPGRQGQVVDRVARGSELGLVALLAERELEHGVVDEPALVPGDLEHEDVVCVVVDGQALRAARRVVGVRLDRVAEGRF